MSIDAIINKVISDGDDLVLDLMAREVGSIASQSKMRIVNFTHIPMVGQAIRGCSGVCIIEPSHGIEQKYYRRIGCTGLKEVFDYLEEAKETKAKSSVRIAREKRVGRI